MKKIKTESKFSSRVFYEHKERVIREIAYRLIDGMTTSEIMLMFNIKSKEYLHELNLEPMVRTTDSMEFIDEKELNCFVNCPCLSKTMECYECEMVEGVHDKNIFSSDNILNKTVPALCPLKK